MVASKNVATSKGFLELVGGLLFPDTLRFYDIMGEASFFALPIPSFQFRLAILRRMRRDNGS